ncbi:MAG: hypothetical protein NTV86_08735 [Planctomycetota bacterium]|nr:hypothetical protein [Planctomycetota bacterium]
MRGILLLLAALAAPVVLILAMGSAGCSDDHHRYSDRDRDRGDRTVIIDRDRHEEHREGERH